MQAAPLALVFFKFAYKIVFRACFTNKILNNILTAHTPKFYYIYPIAILSQLSRYEYEKIPYI